MEQSFDHELQRRERWMAEWRARWGRSLPGAEDNPLLARQWGALIAKVPETQLIRLLTRLEKEHALGGYGPTLEQCRQAWKALDCQLRQQAVTGTGKCTECDGHGWLVVPAVRIQEQQYVKFIIGDPKAGRMANYVFFCLCPEGARRRGNPIARPRDQEAFDFWRALCQRMDRRITFSGPKQAMAWGAAEKAKNPGPLGPVAYCDALIQESWRLHPKAVQEPSKKPKPRRDPEVAKKALKTSMKRRAATAPSQGLERVDEIVKQQMDEYKADW